MKDLLIAIVKGLIPETSAINVEVDAPNTENVVVYHLHVSKEDMGKVIGRQGKIAKAIRTVMRAGSCRTGQKIMVEIEPLDGSSSADAE